MTTTAKTTPKPKVKGAVTLNRRVDFTGALDGWTLEEIEDYLEIENDEAIFYLATDAELIEQNDSVDVSRRDIKKYVEWRKANKLAGRLC